MIIVQYKIRNFNTVVDLINAHFYYTYKVHMPFVLSSFMGCVNYIIIRLPVEFETSYE